MAACNDTPVFSVRSIIAALATSILCNGCAESMSADASAGAQQAFVSSDGAAAAVADATGAALQADMPRALGALRRVPANEYGGADQTFRTAMLERFAGREDDLSADPTEPFARATLATYRAYWRAALADPTRKPQAEANLLVALQQLTGRDDVVDLDAMEPVVAKRLRAEGFHSLQGRTGALRELMLWKHQEERPYRVTLPDGEHTTRVFVLDRFASLGWGDYATCGRRGTGGWATADALFAVVPRYADLDGEEFRVTFLGHETQHFADLARFPAMPPWELEYRAKLVELALADKTRERVLRKLREDQGDDPASPHAYANKRVLAALSRWLEVPDGADLAAVELPKLQAAAAAELRDDTWRRRATRAPVSKPPAGGGGADQ